MSCKKEKRMLKMNRKWAIAVSAVIVIAAVIVGVLYHRHAENEKCFRQEEVRAVTALGELCSEWQNLQRVLDNFKADYDSTEVYTRAKYESACERLTVAHEKLLGKFFFGVPTRSLRSSTYKNIFAFYAAYGVEIPGTNYADFISVPGVSSAVKEAVKAELAMAHKWKTKIDSLQALPNKPIRG